MKTVTIHTIILFYAAATVAGHDRRFLEWTKSLNLLRPRQTFTTDGTCGNTGNGTKGYHCPAAGTNLCCSDLGFCGDTANHCESGCQPAFGTCKPVSSSSSSTNPSSPSGTSSAASSETSIINCGPQHNNQICNLDSCCSPAGFCGSTEAYCQSPDCLLDFGRCDASAIPAGTNTSDITRPLVGSVPYGQDLFHCTQPGMVALTFDDGPYNYTTELLDTLKGLNASATFMVTGNNKGKGEISNTSLAWPSIIQRMHNEGHQIASHTWSHPNLTMISSSDRRNEMYKNEIALQSILGFFPTYMRPPYSSCDDACRADMKDLGYHITYFDLDTNDTILQNASQVQGSKDLFSSKVANVADPKQTQFLVIGHDIELQTATNLTDFMVRTLQGKGFRAVTVGECLGDPVENWYRGNGTEEALGNATTASGSTSASASASASMAGASASGSGSATGASASPSSTTKAEAVGRRIPVMGSLVAVLAVGVGLALL